MITQNVLFPQIIEISPSEFVSQYAEAADYNPEPLFSFTMQVTAYLKGLFTLTSSLMHVSMIYCVH